MIISEKTSSNQARRKKRKVLKVVISSILVFVSLVIIGCSVFQIYHKNRYGHFWVNGQSMYPTLNKNAKYKDGALIGEYDSSDRDGNYDVDYGYMDEKESTLDKLSRFDIIICSYNDSSRKVIKRLIALPGETFYISMSTPGKSDNGNLYIQNKETSEYSLVKQPLDDSLVHGGTYTSEFSTPYTLKDNEYFVMGDNRKGANSSDSRTPSNHVYRNHIYGKVIGLEAYCTIVKVGPDEYDYKDVKHYFPWRSL